MFSPDEIATALTQANTLPPDKRGGVVAVVKADGTIGGAWLLRVNRNWSVSGEVEYHGGTLEGQAQVVVSW